MSSFGKKLRECRQDKQLSQSELARRLQIHHSIIGKYERDEVKPTIDVVKNIASVLGTTVGYLLGEVEEENLLKDPTMLRRLADIERLPQEARNHVLALMDAFLRDAQAKKAYAA